MDKQFIRIGDLYINVADIIEVSADGVDEGLCPVVQVITRALTYIGNDTNVSRWHNFQPGTPEAKAILAWLEERSLVLV